MKLELVRGCVAGSLNVDGVEEVDMTDEQRQAVLDAIFKHLGPADLNYVLQDLIETFGEYEFDPHPCECCGDCVETYTWEI